MTDNTDIAGTHEFYAVKLWDQSGLFDYELWSGHFSNKEEAIELQVAVAGPHGTHVLSNTKYRVDLECYNLGFSSLCPDASPLYMNVRDPGLETIE